MPLATTTEILERFKKREQTTDEFGRVLEVRRLPLGEQLRILGVAGDASRIIGEALVIAASVISLDSFPFKPIKDSADIYERLNMLSEEGVFAARKKLEEMRAVETGLDDPKEVLKNSLPTTASD